MTKQLIYEAGYYDRFSNDHTIGYFTTAESMMNFLHGYAKWRVEDAAEYDGDADARKEELKWASFFVWCATKDFEGMKEGRGYCMNSIYISRIALITSFTKEDIQ